MTSKSNKSTGLGADAFFQTPAVVKSKPGTATLTDSSTSTVRASASVDDKTERRSFNLKVSTLRLLDEVQIKTMRDGNKSTLSAIVERGIELVAKEMGVSEVVRTRVNEHTSKRGSEHSLARINE